MCPSPGNVRNEMKYKLIFIYFWFSSLFPSSLWRTGRGWASVLKTQCSNGRRSSSENSKYRYLARLKKKKKSRKWDHIREVIFRKTHNNLYLIYLSNKLPVEMAWLIFFLHSKKKNPELKRSRQNFYLIKNLGDDDR